VGEKKESRSRKEEKSPERMNKRGARKNAIPRRGQDRVKECGKKRKMPSPRKISVCSTFRTTEKKKRHDKKREEGGFFF